jgi:DNA repair exonuclease SbcCD nuclease subunit
LKILSFGDLHFNCGYDEDIKNSVCQIIEYVSHNYVDLVCITGDVYERASEPGSRNLAAECIQQLAEHAPIIIVKGNHDAPGDLKILSELKSKYPIEVDEIPCTREFYRNSEVSIRIHTLPWLTKARWMTLHPEASKEEGDSTVSQMVLQHLRNVVALGSGYKHILVGHLTIAGAKCQAHQQMSADGITLGLYDLREAGVYAALLGHIHLKQEVGSPLHFYNGSIASLDYGESPDKWFSVLDTKTDKVEQVRLNTVHRQDVNATWMPHGIEIDCNQTSLLYGARVRVNLKVDGGDNLPLAKKAVEDWLKEVGALEYKINPQVITQAQVRSVEISKAESMANKLEQWWLATSRPEDSVTKDMQNKLQELEEELCSQSN